MNLAQLAEAGHFTKVFDPGHTISPEQFDLLMKVLYLVSRVRECLVFAFHGCILNASDVIVFATRQNIMNE